MKDPYAGNTAEDPHAGVEWSRGVLDMAEAIQENRQQRITGAQAAHVIGYRLWHSGGFSRRSSCGNHVGVSTACAHGVGRMIVDVMQEMLTVDRYVP